MPEKTYLALGAPDKIFDDAELEELFSQALSRALSDINDSGHVLTVPPDITRIHSRAGFFNRNRGEASWRPVYSGASRAWNAYADGKRRN